MSCTILSGCLSMIPGLTSIIPVSKLVLIIQGSLPIVKEFEKIEAEVIYQIPAFWVVESMEGTSVVVSPTTACGTGLANSFGIRQKQLTTPSTS